jgi:antitoxin component YwqK of YwqJK toxin-antitoxin module
MIIPTIDNKFEKFDIDKFSKSTKKETDVVREFLPNGNYIEMSMANSGKYYTESYKGSYFMLSKSYYPNGNIKHKGIMFNVPWGAPFQKGIWYEFDENGKLIKEVDYDKPYKYTFEDILKFCEEEVIPVTKGPVLQSTGFHTIISRRIENENPIWEIEWLKKSNRVENIILDGISGKVVSRKEAEYINN